MHVAGRPSLSRHASMEASPRDASPRLLSGAESLLAPPIGRDAPRPSSPARGAAAPAFVAPSPPRPVFAHRDGHYWNLSFWLEKYPRGLSGAQWLRWCESLPTGARAHEYLIDAEAVHRLFEQILECIGASSAPFADESFCVDAIWQSMGWLLDERLQPTLKMDRLAADRLMESFAPYRRLDGARSHWLFERLAMAAGADVATYYHHVRGSEGADDASEADFASQTRGETLSLEPYLQCAEPNGRPLVIYQERFEVGDEERSPTRRRKTQLQYYLVRGTQNAVGADQASIDAFEEIVDDHRQIKWWRFAEGSVGLLLRLGPIDGAEGWPAYQPSVQVDLSFKPNTGQSVPLLLTGLLCADSDYTDEQQAKAMSLQVQATHEEGGSLEV